MRALALLPLVMGLSACRKEAPAIPPPPPLCVQVEHGKDKVIAEVNCAQRDEDEDGIDDAVDRCPVLKETMNKFLDRDGCPDPDKDLDFFVDSADACPEVPGDPPDGCPPADIDNDGIADHLDACPSKPEDIDGEDDADGCPEGEVRSAATALTDQLWRKRSIAMKRGSARPTGPGKAERALLSDDVIARSGEILRARVVSWGTKREAKSLARRRARAIVRDLTEGGLDEARVETVLQPRSSQSRGRVDVFLYVAIGDETIKIKPEPPAPEPEPVPTTDAGPQR